MAKITNKDIADRAGVSPAAVSMAIHGKKGISDATRTHILNIVQELNYKPPIRSRTAQMRTIVLLLPGSGEPMLPALVQALLQLARESRYELRILSADQALTDAAQTLSGCDLLITFDGLDRATLDQLAELVRQILVVDGNFSRKPYWNVRTDYAGAAYHLTRHLAELGHRNFIYLNDDLPSSKNLLCLSGFQRLLLEQHLPLDPVQIIMELSRDANIWAHVPDIIRSTNISAIICTSARAAFETTRRLTGFGYRVPEDISVAAVTWDNSSTFSLPSFTHVSLNCDAIEQELRRLSMRFIPPDEVVDVLIPYSQIIPGDSVAPPKYNPAEKKLAIALHLKDHPSLRVVRAGFLNRIQQMGYQAEVIGIESGDPLEYEAALRDLLDMDVDGVASWLVTPNTFREFSRKGVPVVVLHGLTRGSGDVGEQVRISADPTLIARSVANYYAQHLAGRTGVLAVSQSDDNHLESSITRELIRIMAEICPQITVVHAMDFVGLSRYNTDLVLDYIRQTPDLVGAFTTAGNACVTWAEARRAAGRDDILIVGTDYSDESIHLVESGEIGGFIAQPLYEEGQMGVVALDAILRGNPFPSSCLLDAPMVTRENLEKYRRLLQDVKNWYV